MCTQLQVLQTWFYLIVSEGRDKKIINAIADAVRKVRMFIFMDF